MRTIFKRLVQLLFVALASPFALIFFLGKLLVKPDAIFQSLMQILSLIPGKCGCLFRAGFLKLTLSECSLDISVSFLVLMSHCETELEGNLYIGPQCNIGLCKIEKDTLLGSGVHIMSGSTQHHFDDLNTPIKDQGGTFEKITIGGGAWIGNGALIMADVGKGAIVAAGSIVVKEVPDFAIVGGNPARVIKYRS
ncbi:MAG: virginiamycin A acetyltransferase [Psychroserpens sp.]|jgi:virginiamycin A acetyltransferase